VTAWEQGPVVPELYREYRSYRWNPLPIPTEVDIGAFDPTTLAVIESILVDFGGLSTEQLTAMTHTHEPWVKTWAKAKDATSKSLGYDVIPDPQIEAYFSAQIAGPNDPRKLTPDALAAAVHAQPGWAEEQERSVGQIDAGQGLSLGELRRFLGL
jgi:hypothetical protein